MTTMKGPDPYAIAEDRLDRLFNRAAGLQELYDGLCRILNEAVPTYTWVGIYLVEGAELTLAAWHGPAPAERLRLPRGAGGQGPRGTAASSGETIVVPDLAANPRYRAPLLATRAEIVVPIGATAGDGRPARGEIDVRSEHQGAFGPADREFLEALAARLAARIAGAAVVR